MPGIPKWSQVIARTTYDMETGKIIEHLVIDDSISATVLHRRLPEGVSLIKTVLLYTADENEKSRTSTGANGGKQSD